MPRKKNRARGRRYAPPVPGELFAVLGPLGFSEARCTHLEDQAAAAAEHGEEFRVVLGVDWSPGFPGLLGRD